MLISFIEHYFKDLRLKQEKFKNTLASNSLHSLEQYKHLIGKIQGIEEAIVTAQDLYNKMVEQKPL